MKKKKQKWMSFRHKIALEIVRPFFAVTSRLIYHIKVDKFKEEGKRNWLILSNHQTDYDQFFVGLAFRQQIYYIATEDLFSNGFLSKVIKWLVNPIPFMKASTDIKAMMSCLRLAREGGTIALFPEGNRTYSGKTCYIKPSVVSLAKKMGLPIAVFRIEGGYGIKPRWSSKSRRGYMKAGVRRVIEPEEYNNMSNDELYELIKNELYVDEMLDKSEFKSKALAENIERMLYVCPDCGLSEFMSDKNTFSCKKCGRTFRYLSDKSIEGIGFESRFKNASEWYDYQEEYIRSLDMSAFISSEPIYEDCVNISEVIVYDRKHLIEKNIRLALYTDRIEIGQEKADADFIMPFTEIQAMACMGVHKLNIFAGDKIYQIKGSKSFNALKYCNIYYHGKFTTEEHKDGEFQFLGL